MGRPATLDDIPDRDLDWIAAKGFDWVWLLSVWQTGLGARHISRTNPEWRREFEETLPDLQDEDIAGSGFAISGYTVHQALCGDAGLARLRDRLKQRGLKLMLDFVPNHMALDHPWIDEHPDCNARSTILSAEFAAILGILRSPCGGGAQVLRGRSRVRRCGRSATNELARFLERPRLRSLREFPFALHRLVPPHVWGCRSHASTGSA